VGTEEFHEALRLAHSWREKAVQLLTFNKRSLESGSIERKKFLQLQKLYEAQARAADLRLRQLLAEGTRAIDEAGRRLQDSLARQRALQTLVAAQEIEPARANDQHQEIEQVIHLSRLEITRYNALLSAPGSVALGGFVDRPIEGYGAVATPAKAGRTGRFSSVDRITMVVALLIILAAAGYLSYTRVFKDKITFSATAGFQATAPVMLTCQNDGLQTLLLAVPWDDQLRAGGDADYGVDVLVRTSGGEPFRLYTDSQDLWSQLGEPTTPGDPVALESGLTAQFEFSRVRLKKLEPTLTQMRIRCTTPDGTRLYRFDAPLP
jgi:hypothetical protein